MVFLTESWFWRGTQSAIFYYVACTPWVEYKHKRKRRREATQSQKDRHEAVINEQPGVIIQPAPFQTNEDWAQEIVQGPGPPKGWKRDALYYKHAGRFQHDDQPHTRRRGETTTSTDSPSKSEYTGITNSSTAVESITKSLEASGYSDSPMGMLEAEGLGMLALKITTPQMDSVSYQGTPKPPDRSFESYDDDQRASYNKLRNLHSSSSKETATTGSKRASFESSIPGDYFPSQPRPSMEKRLSTAMDGFKDAMRAALHPEHWNWIRYDRDDEILSNINERMRGVWGTVKGSISFPLEEQVTKESMNDAKESHAENQAKKWQRGTHPAVNDLSPPIVSQLPYSREEAHWILLPPPSADVMMGRARPDLFDDIKRKPLCIMGREPPPNWPSTQCESPAMASAEETDNVSEFGSDATMPGWTHVQKPQRAHLLKGRRASYGFETPSV